MVPVFEMMACITTAPETCAARAIGGYTGSDPEILLPAMTPLEIFAGPAGFGTGLTTGVGAQHPDRGYPSRHRQRRHCPCPSCRQRRQRWQAVADLRALISIFLGTLVGATMASSAWTILTCLTTTAGGGGGRRRWRRRRRAQHRRHGGLRQRIRVKERDQNHHGNDREIKRARYPHVPAGLRLQLAGRFHQRIFKHMQPRSARGKAEPIDTAAFRFVPRPLGNNEGRIAIRRKMRPACEKWIVTRTSHVWQSG